MAVEFITASSALAAASAAGAFNVTAPAGLQDDDLLLACIWSNGAGVTIDPPDEAWTLVATGDGGGAAGITASIFSYTAAASDSSTAFTFTASGANTTYGMISVWRGVDTAAPIDSSTPQVQFNAASDSVGYPAFTPSQPRHHVAIGFYKDDNTSSFEMAGGGEGFTVRWFRVSSTGTDGSCYGFSAESDGSGSPATSHQAHTSTATADVTSIGMKFALVEAATAPPPQTAVAASVLMTAAVGVALTVVQGWFVAATSVAMAAAIGAATVLPGTFASPASAVALSALVGAPTTTVGVVAALPAVVPLSIVVGAASTTVGAVSSAPSSTQMTITPGAALPVAVYRSTPATVQLTALVGSASTLGLQISAPAATTLAVAVGTATPVRGANLLTPSSVQLTALSGTTTTTVGAVSSTPATVLLTAAVGAASTAGQQISAPAVTTLAVVVGAATPVRGAVSSIPAAVTGIVVVGAPALAPGVVTAAAGSVPLTAAVGAATTTSAQIAAPASVTLAIVVGSPTLARGAVLATPGTTVLTAAVGIHSTAGAIKSIPAVVVLTASVGAAVTTGGQVTAAPSVALAVQVGTATTVLGAVKALPSSTQLTVAVGAASSGAGIRSFPAVVQLAMLVGAPTTQQVQRSTPAAVQISAVVGSATVVRSLRLVVQSVPLVAVAGLAVEGNILPDGDITVRTLFIDWEPTANAELVSTVPMQIAIATPTMLCGTLTCSVDGAVFASSVGAVTTMGSGKSTPSSVVLSMTVGAAVVSGYDPLVDYPMVGSYNGILSGNGYPLLMVTPPAYITDPVTPPFTDGRLWPTYINNIARHDTMVITLTPCYQRPDIVTAIKAANPKCRILAYVHAAGGGFSPETMWGPPYSAFNPPMSRLETVRYNYLTAAPARHIKSTTPAWSDDWVNFAHQSDFPGHASGVYDVAIWWANKILEYLAFAPFDGLFLDVICQRGLFYMPQADCDLPAMGYTADTAGAIAWDNHFIAGVGVFYATLRAGLPAQMTFTGNCGLPFPPQYTYFNGWMREAFPRQGDGTWVGNMLKEPFANQFGYLVAPFQSPQESWLIYSPGAYLSAGHEQIMRFTLGSAALGRGWGTHGTGMEVETHHIWWWPEYDNNGAGKGYLGQPLGPYVEISPPVKLRDVVDTGTPAPDWEATGAYYRKFTKGAVIVNPKTYPTATAETVDLGELYYAVRNPGVYSTSFTVPPNDAVFLVKA